MATTKVLVLGTEIAGAHQNCVQSGSAGVFVCAVQIGFGGHEWVGQASIEEEKKVFQQRR